jgi:hypothetical protein
MEVETGNMMHAVVLAIALAALGVASVPARAQELKVEKIIPGKSKGLVRIGPLDPGRYEFMGEFHADTAKGVVVAE